VRITALSRLFIKRLLQMQSAVLDELKLRKVLRTKNNPVADYTEWLVSKSLDLKLVSNSRSGYDANDRRGIRYQIKGRRITPGNPSTQFSAIRNLRRREFDVLIAVIFNADYSVRYSAAVPHSVIMKLAHYQRHTNSWIVHLRPSVLTMRGVKDLTGKLAGG